MPLLKTCTALPAEPVSLESPQTGLTSQEEANPNTCGRPGAAGSGERKKRVRPKALAPRPRRLPGAVRCEPGPLGPLPLPLSRRQCHSAGGQPRQEDAAPLPPAPAPSPAALLTGCPAAARPGRARAAAANAALFGAHRLHARCRRVQAGLPRARIVLQPRRRLQLLVCPSRDSGSLAGLRQHHEGAGLRAMPPAPRKPAGTWLGAHAVPPPSAARLPPPAGAAAPCP